MIFDPGAILGRLVEGGVDFVVIGGLAATLHGASPLTALPCATADNIETVAATLHGASLLTADVDIM